MRRPKDKKSDTPKPARTAAPRDPLRAAQPDEAKSTVVVGRERPKYLRKPETAVILSREPDPALDPDAHAPVPEKG